MENLKMEIILNKINKEDVTNYTCTTNFIDEKIVEKRGHLQDDIIFKTINSWVAKLVENNLNYLDEYKLNLYEKNRPVITTENEDLSGLIIRTEVYDYNDKLISSNLRINKDTFGVSKYSEGVPTVYFIFKNQFEMRIKIHSNDFDSIKDSIDLANLLETLYISIYYGKNISDLNHINNLIPNIQLRIGNVFHSYLDINNGLKFINQLILNLNSNEDLNININPQSFNVNNQTVQGIVEGVNNMMNNNVENVNNTINNMEAVMMNNLNMENVNTNVNDVIEGYVDGFVETLFRLGTMDKDEIIRNINLAKNQNKNFDLGTMCDKLFEDISKACNFNLDENIFNVMKKSFRNVLNRSLDGALNN